MKKEKGFYVLLLTEVLAIAFLSSVTVHTAKAEYVEGDPDFGEYEYEDYEEDGELAVASGDADEDGSCSCWAWTQAIADGGESRYAYADASGWWMIDWTWNGAPGQAPGGTLDWSVTGIGADYAYGENKITSGSATSASDSDSELWGYGTEGSADGSGEAWGSVEDEKWGSGGWDADGYPSEDFDVTDYDESAYLKRYSYAVEWDFKSGDLETIPSGTTYIYFSGGAG